MAFVVPALARRRPGSLRLKVLVLFWGRGDPGDIECYVWGR